MAKRVLILFSLFSILLFSWLLLILWMMVLILIQMVFVQKELVNLEKNSIYISYERFNSIDQEENISKAGQFLRKYKLDNAADV
jgi:lipopolysaccharide/colanic/teichoic acid biosynthesis glycosyltransferase